MSTVVTAGCAAQVPPDFHGLADCLLLSQKRPKGVKVKVAPEIKAFRDKLKQSKVNVRKWVEEVSAHAVAVAASERVCVPSGWHVSAPRLGVGCGLRRPTTMAAAL